MNPCPTLVFHASLSSILLATAALAQPGLPPSEGFATPLSSGLRDPKRVYYSEPGDGPIVARAEGYSAQFDAHGAAFVPFLGSSAPRCFPIRFELASATCGGSALALGGAAAPERDGNEVRIARGALHEVYQLGPEALEQEFVIDHALGAGDLDLSIAVETELSVREIGAGLEFSNEFGSASYSGAVAVDARGARVAASTRWSQGTIEIVVPGSFLADAIYPVVIDPMIFAVTSGAHDDLSPDVAYTFTGNRYLVVYEEALSALDHDIWAVEFDANGNVIAGSLKLVSSGGSFALSSHPRVASNRITNQFLVVWQDKAGLFGPTLVQSRTYASASLALGPITTISPADGVSRLVPDVGGDTEIASNSNFCVVWEKADSTAKHTIEAQLVATSGAPTGALKILDSSNHVNAFPRISKSDGVAPLATMDWTVVWQREYSATDHDILAAQLHRDGTTATAIFIVDGSTTDDTHPSVSSLVEAVGGAREYMITWQRATGSVHHLIGHRNRGDVFLDQADLSDLEFPGLAGDWTLPTVETDGANYLVAGSLYAAGVHNIVFAPFAPVGAHVLLQAGAMETTPIDGIEPSISSLASKYTGGIDLSQRFLLVRDFRSAPGANRAVWGLLQDIPRFDVICTPGDGVTAPCPCGNAGVGFGWGCDNSAHTGGGTLFASGNPWVGFNDTVLLQATHLLPSALCTFWQGDAVNEQGIAFGSGRRCFAGHLLRLAIRNAVSGSSSYPQAGDPSISARCEALGSPIAGATLRYYQVSYRDPASPCGAPATFNTTAGIQMLWW